MSKRMYLVTIDEEALKVTDFEITERPVGPPETPALPDWSSSYFEQSAAAFRFEQRMAFTTTVGPSAFAAITGLADSGPSEPTPLVTMTQTIDLNPNHRRVRSLRDLWKQVRDIVKWEYNKAAGNPQPETRTITIPDLEWRPAS